MPEWATEVITWDKAREYIEPGTVESLGHLRRSEQQLTTYRAFMDKVLAGLIHTVARRRLKAAHTLTTTIPNA